MESDEEDVKSNGSVSSCGFIYNRNIKSKVSELSDFLDWSIKNCDKLRVEPMVGTLDNEYDQLNWLWKCLEINLDEPLLLRKFIIPVEKGGIEPPYVPELEEYVSEMLQNENICGRLNNLDEDIEILEDELIVKVNEIAEIKKELAKLDESNVADPTFVQVKKSGKHTKESLGSALNESSDLVRRKDELGKKYLEVRRMRKNINGEIELLRDKRESIEAKITAIAKNVWKEDKKMMANFKVAMNALGNHVNKCLQTLGNKCRIKSILEDGSLHGGNINPLAQGNWRAVYRNIMERLYPDSVENVIVLVHDLLVDAPRDGEMFESYYHRMLERARIIEDQSITVMSWREMASITALTKGSKNVMGGYLASERQLRMAQKEGVQHGSPIDPIKDRQRWAARMSDYVRTLSEGVKNEKRLSKLSTGNTSSTVSPTATQKPQGNSAPANTAMAMAAIESKAEPKTKWCHSFVKTGKCPRGDKCYFIHPEPGECERFRSVMKTNNFLFLMDSNSSQYPRKTIYWDSAASGHYTSDASGNSVASCSKCVSGLGGTKTVQGTVSGAPYGMQEDVHVVHGLPENTTLLSVGLLNKPNAIGEEGVTIFKGDMGVRAHVTIEQSQAIEAILDDLEMDGRIEGRAMLASNNIYEQLRDVTIADDDAEAYDLSDTFEELEESAYIATELIEEDVAKIEDVSQSPMVSLKSSKKKATKFYNRRVKLDSPEELARLLCDSNLTRRTLVEGIKNDSIDGLPNDLTVDVVNSFFHNSGPDVFSQMGSMTTTPLDETLASTPTHITGNTLLIDAIDPPFSRLPEYRARITKSINGYRDCVLGLDEGSGFLTVIGRKTKDNPDEYLNTLIDVWFTKHRKLEVVKTDDEFILRDEVEIMDGSRIRIQQAPPFDHRRVLHSLESANRWIQDMAQKSMNRLYQLVVENWLTEVQWCKLWYHSVVHAIKVWNLAPSTNDPTKTRFEMWHGHKPNLKSMVLLPFGTMIMSRRGTVGSFGRGTPGIYVGASPTVPGGIIVYNPKKSSLLQTGSFTANTYLPIPTDYDRDKVIANFLGDCYLTSPDEEVQMSDSPSSEGDVGDVIYMMEEQVIPPKPLPPRNKRLALLKDAAWRAALMREVRKMVSAGTFRELKGDERKMIDRLIRLRLIPVLEFKWKTCPVTGVERWLECVRLVADGSQDHRDNMRFAVMPCRTILLVMLGVNAHKRWIELCSDAIRAYLQAKPISDEVMIDIPEYISSLGLPTEAMCNTALYGTTDAALAFQIFVDDRLSKCGYIPLEIAQSVYIRNVDGLKIRVIRHADDFLMSGVTCDRVDVINQEMNAIRSQIEMTDPTPVSKFLGMEVVRYDAEGRSCIDGNYVVLRMRTKIVELFKKFEYLVGEFNPRGKFRQTPGPSDSIRVEFEEGNVMANLLTEDEHAVFRKLVGGIMWIVNSYRWDVKFVCFVLTLRMHRPRKWDMLVAVWALEYLHNTAHVPLILGGPDLEIIVYSDASFATLPESRSPKGHLLKLSENSGAIACEIHCVTIAVKSVYEAELIACSEGFDTAAFILNVLNDLEIEGVPTPPIVKSDSEAVVNWINGANVTTHSRHLQPKYWGTRHIVKEGSISLTHVAGVDNPADILTKVLPLESHLKHLANIMGHNMIGFPLVGVQTIFENLNV